MWREEHSFQSRLLFVTAEFAEHRKERGERSGVRSVSSLRSLRDSCVLRGFSSIG